MMNSANSKAYISRMMSRAVCVALVTLLLATDGSKAQPDVSVTSSSDVVVKLNTGSALPKIAPLVKYTYTSPDFNGSGPSVTPASYTTVSYTVYYPTGYVYSGLWRAGISGGAESVYAVVKSTYYPSGASNGVSLTEYMTPFSTGYTYSTVKKYTTIYFYSVSIYVYSTYYILTGYVYYA